MILTVFIAYFAFGVIIVHYIKHKSSGNATFHLKNISLQKVQNRLFFRMKLKRNLLEATMTFRKKTRLNCSTQKT
jgi:hypothetical protein